jgi:hypothetical protein
LKAYKIAIPLLVLILSSFFWIYRAGEDDNTEFYEEQPQADALNRHSSQSKEREPEEITPLEINEDTWTLIEENEQQDSVTGAPIGDIGELSCKDVEFLTTEAFNQMMAWGSERYPSASRAKDVKRLEKLSNEQLQSMVDDGNDVALAAEQLAKKLQKAKVDAETIRDLYYLSALHGSLESIDNLALMHYRESQKQLKAGNPQQAYSKRLEGLAWSKLVTIRNQALSKSVFFLGNGEHDLDRIQEFSDALLNLGMHADPVEMELEAQSQAEQLYYELNQQRLGLGLPSYDNIDKLPPALNELLSLIDRFSDEAVMDEEFEVVFETTLEECGADTSLFNL